MHIIFAFRSLIALILALTISACVSGDVLESASTEQQLASSQSNSALQSDQSNLSALTSIDSVDAVYTQPRTRKIYLVNGLLSAVPFIGYGFRNLSKKMPEAKLYSYLTPIEGAGAVMPAIISDAEKAYKADPNVSINLVGISLGGDLITSIASQLADKNIPVNYLGIVDGTSLRPIKSNVRKVDNLTCTNLDCTRAKVRLAEGNTTTILVRKLYKSSHIPLGDHAEMHKRVIAQIRS